MCKCNFLHVYINVQMFNSKVNQPKDTEENFRFILLYKKAFFELISINNSPKQNIF